MMRINLARVALTVAVFTITAGLVACGGGGGGGGGGGSSGATIAPVDGYPYPVQYFEDITPPAGSGQRHMPAGETFNYNSDPPTNGRHTDLAAPWGVSEVAVPKETAVHNMEHSGVVVWYNCNAGETPLSAEECAVLRNGLSAIVQPRVAQGRYVLMTPYPEMEHRIALTSWQVLDAFDEFDPQRVETFIDTFECYVDIEGFCR